ncbi:MAG: hypothetical protein ACI4Q3_07955 [Kiritimatiellia bacterium]
MKMILALVCGALVCGRPHAAEVAMPLLEDSAEATALTWERARGFGHGFVRDGDEIVCDNGTNRVARGAGWTLRLDQTEPRPFSVTAEGRAVTDGGASGDFNLYLDVAYADGSHLYGQKAGFDADPASGWQRRTVTVMPAKPVRSVAVYELQRGRPGCVRFRRPAVRFPAARGAQMFDGCAVVVGKPIREPAFFLRDVKANTGYVALADEALGLRMAVRTERVGGAAAGTSHDVTLTETTRADRALTLIYALPLGAGELTWFNDLRTSCPLDHGERMDALSVDVGRGLLSRWPFGAVSAAGTGVALGIDPAAPACFRVLGNANARVLMLAYDLGFTAERPQAHLRFVSFPFTAADGFRGALESYQRLYPEAFRVRVPRQGVWMAFKPISKVARWEDFGFAFKEGDGETAWDDEHGFLTFRYTEPCTWWMALKGDLNALDLLTDGVAEARRLAVRGVPMARGWETSRFLDVRGRERGRLLDTPWCKGVVWSVNSAPGIVGEMTDWKAKNGDPAFTRRLERPFPQGNDGEYVDSAEMYVTETFDFNRAHFGCMDTPLSFARDSLAPGIYKGMIAYEYVRRIAARVHALGKFAMANSTPNRWCWLAPHLDVMGTETDWNPLRNGTRTWQPMSDDALLYRRALCGGKPYCFLMNTDFDRFPYEYSDKFMQRALAYGMFPGYFSANASTGHYFTRPDLYNRDRPLFRKYVPLCRLVAEAGWRPVNRLVRSSNPQVVTEQFGDGYATVYNLSDKPQRAELSFSAPLVEERVEGRAFADRPRQLLLDLPGESVRVFVFANGK